MQAEEQSEVAVDSLALEDFGGLDALPGGGDLDEDTLAADAGLVVLRDDLARLRDGLVGVVGEARIDLGGDAAGDDGEDLASEGDGKRLEGERGDGLIGG